MRRDLSNVPHYVYRYYDAKGRPLYIGCTYNVERREQGHRVKPWFVRVVRREVDEYPTLAEGRAAEKAAIEAERPSQNVYHVIETVSGCDMPRTTVRRLIAARRRYYEAKRAAS